MKDQQGAVTNNGMPDVASMASKHIHSELDWVGMSEIHQPATLRDTISGVQPIAARVQTYVNLKDPSSRGIHMSRLYLALEETFAKAPVDADSIRSLLNHFLETHGELSSRAFVQLDFDLSMRRESLKSQHFGWKGYPVTLSGTLENGELKLELTVNVPYSSTCPCSAALSRQLIQEAFRKQFENAADISVDQVAAWLGTEQGIVATPHSQRSIAQVKVLLDHSVEKALPITALINTIEEALQTPVQTAVKREDEQEFARLNGQNLMFCEDAARKLQQALLPVTQYQDFWLRVNHLESLHAHNAVAIVTKNVAGGYQPIPGDGV